MRKKFSWTYIVYLIISSFFIKIEHPNLFLHLLNIIPTAFLLYVYLQHCSQSYSLENYLVLIPLIIFPFSETIIYLFAKEPDEPLITMLNGIYFFTVHICFIIIYRMEGSKVITFTKTDYFQVFPILIATFLVFGYIFLPIIPGQFIFLMMLIAALLAILLAHIINRPIQGKSYIYGILGGILIAITDFFAGYSTFFDSDIKYYVLYRFAYFLGLFYFIESLLAKQSIFILNSQKELFTEHKQ